MLKSNFDSIVIMTDLEGDDAVAIKILAKRFSSIPTLVIVGEGNVDKVALGRNIFGASGFTNFTVVQGIKTTKEFPAGSLNSFPAFEPPHQGEHDEYATQLVGFLEKHPETLILALKPIGELMQIDANLLSSTTLYFSGAFNLRSMLKTYPSVVPFINTTFAQVIHFENFLVTATNSLADQAVVDKIFQDKALEQLVRSWNALTWDDCLDTTRDLSVQIRDELNCPQQDWEKLDKLYDRITKQNLHIAGNMIAARARQVCFADIAFVTLLFFASPKTLQSLSWHKADLALDDRNYTIMQESSASKVLFMGKLGDINLLYTNILNLF